MVQPNSTRAPNDLAAPSASAWSTLNRTLPAPVSRLVTFDDRAAGGPSDLYGSDHRTSDDGALFVTARSPVPVSTPVTGETSSIGVPVVCWDLVCGHMEPDSVVRVNRDTIVVLPDNVFFDGWDTDRILDENLRNQSNGLYDCNYYVVQSEQLCSNQAQLGNGVAAWAPVMESVTPNVATGFHLERIVLREEPHPFATAERPTQPHLANTAEVAPARPPLRLAADLGPTRPASFAGWKTEGPAHGGVGSDSPRALSAVADIGVLVGPPMLPVVAAALAALALVLALYHRIARHNVLRCASRQRIVDLLGAEPGLRTATVADRVGLDFKTTQNHLRVLERLGIVASVGGAQRRFYLAGRLPAEGVQALSAMSSPMARQLYRDLVAHGPSDLQAVCARLGCARSTAGEAATHLAHAGLLDKQRRNRRIVLTAHPSPALAVPQAARAPPGPLAITPAVLPETFLPAGPL